MQIMPRTARQLRVNPHDPRQSIEGLPLSAGARDAWKETISDERALQFILASYNVGIGHVQDAVRLAEKNGDDPKSWDDVAYWLIRKSKRGVYNDPVVKYGYRARHRAGRLRRRILDRFEQLQRVRAGGAGGAGGGAGDVKQQCGPEIGVGGGL